MIYKKIKIKGAHRELTTQALIDTGASISLMPLRVAQEIGAWITNQKIAIRGVHENIEYLPLVVADLHFPDLSNIVGRFLFVMSEKQHQFIVGMDILRPIGVSISTKDNSLSIKNEIWEAFKTITTTGVIIYGGVKLVDVLTRPKSNAKLRPTTCNGKRYNYSL